MANELVLSHSVALSVSVSKEIDGLEMGVLSDGRSYFTGRSLARVCGVAPSTIINQGDRWLTGDRNNKLAQMLVAQGLDRESLFDTVQIAGKKVHAYPDDVCMVFLEYYAFETPAPSDQARQNFRKLAKAGLRLFVYHALGYDPAKQVPEKWRQFHDRMVLHATPAGYYSVFKECSEFVLAAIRGGLPSDEHTIPDISVGIGWAKRWESERLEERFGPRRKADHNYPDYFRQAASNPQPMSIYPIESLGEFRKWLMGTYVPEKFPTYLQAKVTKGVLPASTAELLLAEVTPKELTAGDEAG